MKSQFVLFLNHWGACAKVLHPDDGGLYFRAEDLASCQQHFHETLLATAKGRKTVEVAQAGDDAYVYCDDVKFLLDFATRFFQDITVRAGAFSVWPVRGALAEGAEKINELWTGPGQVDAAYLEKSAQKGMRLFITEPLGARLQSKWFRQVSTKGYPHWEINWMKSGGESYLRRALGPRTMAEHFDQAGTKLIGVDSDFCRQLGASFKDLLRWSP
jgi:hypothetical protein